MVVGHRKILAWQLAKLPRYWREGPVEVRPFPAEKRLCVSEGARALRWSNEGEHDDGSPRSRCAQV